MLSFVLFWRNCCAAIKALPMILECPECSTRYLVPDSAIGVEGRTVRCATCRHSWFQSAPDSLDLDAAAMLPPQAQPVRDDIPASVRPLPPEDPSPGEGWGLPVTHDESREVAVYRRSPARRWTMLAFGAGLLMLIAIAAIIWLGQPGLASRFGLALWSSNPPLLIKQNPIDRRELDNGSQLFAVSGQVVNNSSSTQRVPDLIAELRDAHCRVVFNWTITPPQRTVAAGGAVAFNSAKLDVPGQPKLIILSFAGEDGRPASDAASGERDCADQFKSKRATQPKPLQTPAPFASGARLPAGDTRTT